MGPLFNSHITKGDSITKLILLNLLKYQTPLSNITTHTKLVVPIMLLLETTCILHFKLPEYANLVFFGMVFVIIPLYTSKYTRYI